MIELDERRRGIRDEARAFVRDEVLPLAAELDPRGEDMPWSLVDRLGELGYLGATVPEEHGGLGFGMVDYCILIEELARGWLSVASVVGRHRVARRRHPALRPHRRPAGGRAPPRHLRVPHREGRESFPDGLTGTPIDRIGYHGLTTWELTFDGSSSRPTRSWGSGTRPSTA